MKLAIIANPISGRGRGFQKLERYLATWHDPDWEVRLFKTQCAEHAGVLARELLDCPPDILAICGGDGTLNEVLTAVPNPPFPVAMLPAGTANVLAHELRLPLDPIPALKVALQRVVRHVDLGRLHGRKQHRFLLMTGIGLDAHIVARVKPRALRRIGIARYYLVALAAVASYSFPEFRVLAGEEILTATSCLVANASRYGGGLVFTPQADMRDGLFDVLVYQGKSRMDHCRFLFSAWIGKPRTDRNVAYRQVPSMKIEGPRGIWVQADGDLVGTLPLEITLSPASFPLIVP